VKTRRPLIRINTISVLQLVKINLVHEVYGGIHYFKATQRLFWEDKFGWVDRIAVLPSPTICFLRKPFLQSL